jgi:hypothetical protein
MTTRIGRNTASCALVALLLAPGAALAAGADDKAPWKKGSTVVISGCVEPAQKGDEQFVVTNVREMPLDETAAVGTSGRDAVPARPARYLYWLKDTDELEDHVGSQVRIAAKVEDVERKEMEVKRRQGTVYVEVDGDGDAVRMTPAQAGVTPPARGDDEKDVPIWLVELDVLDVDVIAESCPRR